MLRLRFCRSLAAKRPVHAWLHHLRTVSQNMLQLHQTINQHRLALPFCLPQAAMVPARD